MLNISNIEHIIQKAMNTHTHRGRERGRERERGGVGVAHMGGGGGGGQLSNWMPLFDAEYWIINIYIDVMKFGQVHREDWSRVLDGDMAQFCNTLVRCSGKTWPVHVVTTHLF